jgi:hypothetical protein
MMDELTERNAYLAEIEEGFQKRIQRQRRLDSEGVRQSISGGFGSVVTNPRGLVLAVDLDPDAVRYVEEKVLASRIVDAINKADRSARQLRAKLAKGE